MKYRKCIEQDFERKNKETKFERDFWTMNSMGKLTNKMWIFSCTKWAMFLILLSVMGVNCRSSNSMMPRHTIESNSIQRIFTEKGHATAYDASRALKRVFLSNRTITCNDGSQAGFYLRRSLKSKRWVVFLEGGWHCYDLKSCRARWMRLRHLMTSSQWPESRDVGGILSPTEEDNPYWHDANHVFVPYCSSDSWSGTKVQPETRDGWSFMGSLIIKQVIADLLPLGLGRSQGGEILLAGSSAGALGVMLNLDKVKDFLRNERGMKIAVRGISDSGWFLDREPYTPGAIAAVEVVRQGWKLWGGALPDACTQKHLSEPWRCYFGHRIYPTLTSPLFVFQWLFDEAQMRADSVGAPVTPQQWDYIHEMGGALRTSLDNVTAVFAPSCIGHSVLTKRDWLHIKIDDISLAQALRCWEQSTRHGNKEHSRRASDGKNKRNKARKDKNPESQNKQDNDNCNERRRRNRERNKNKIDGGHHERHRLSKEERQERRRNMTKEERQRRRKNMRCRNQTTKIPTATSIPRSERSPMINDHTRNNDRYGNVQRLSNKVARNGTTTELSNNNRRNNGHKRRKNRNQDNKGKKAIAEPQKCSLRLLERCSWPQCNHSCPTLTNPLTGEEMRFLELLASFGLDIEAVATALGVDMQTLNNMEHAELVKLLTQQTS